MFLIMAIWDKENSREGQKTRKVLYQTRSYFKKKFISLKMDKQGLSVLGKI